MDTQQSKKQAILKREQQILKLSRKMVVESGYHGLSLDTLSSELGVSRGTIYNHFTCKEEILLALVIETMDRRREMFQHAAAFPGPPRVRIAAIGVAAEIFVRLYPDHFLVEQIVKSDSIWDKTSAERQSKMKICQVQCVGICGGIVRDGVAQGHLLLQNGATAEAVVFGLWSMAEGAYSIIATSDAMSDLGITEPFMAVRDNWHRMLDGYRWEPLASDFDYPTAMKEMAKELFPKEFQMIADSW